MSRVRRNYSHPKLENHGSPVTNTEAPSARKSRAIVSPMPQVEPVIRQTISFIFMAAPAD